MPRIGTQIAGEISDDWRIKVQSRAFARRANPKVDAEPLNHDFDHETLGQIFGPFTSTFGSPGSPYLGPKP